MASLANYLLTNRKRLTLSQSEVAFLLGFKGMEKGSNISRDESYIRTPSLQSAIAYEMIYGVPMRELFAGLYEQVEQEVASRAKLMSYRIASKPRPRYQEVITNLVAKLIPKSDEQNSN